MFHDPAQVRQAVQRLSECYRLEEEEARVAGSTLAESAGSLDWRVRPLEGSQITRGGHPRVERRSEID
jgi:hypothetical protein